MLLLPDFLNMVLYATNHTHTCAQVTYDLWISLAEDSCLEVVYRMYWLCYHIHTYKKTQVLFWICSPYYALNVKKIKFALLFCLVYLVKKCYSSFKAINRLLLCMAFQWVEVHLWWSQWSSQLSLKKLWALDPIYITCSSVCNLFYLYIWFWVFGLDFNSVF